MKVLIVYPNLPMMITPATSVGIFTSILKQENCDVEMFETTLYSESENQGMLFKSKLGGGRSYELKQLGFSLKPTDVLIPDFKQKVINYKPDLLLFSLYHKPLAFFQFLFCLNKETTSDKTNSPSYLQITFMFGLLMQTSGALIGKAPPTI